MIRSRKHFQERTVETQVPPLRSFGAPVGMTIRLSPQAIKRETPDPATKFVILEEPAAYFELEAAQPTRRMSAHIYETVEAWATVLL
jgi:hypothetical protein